MTSRRNIRSQAWKDLERQAAKALGGQRISRGMDFGRSDYDVHVPDHPHLKIDCKYRKGGFMHHSLLKECREKYCKQEGDVALIVSKGRNERGAVVSLSLEDFARILGCARRQG